MARRILPVLLLLAALGASGCTALRALLGDVTKPELTFKRLELSGLSFDAATLGVVYEIDNPYEIPIEIARVDYRLAVEGTRVFEGSPNQGVRIPAGRSREIVFPARVRYAEIARVAKSIFTKQKLGWQASGTLGVDTPVGVVSFPLSKSGTFDRPDLPEVRIAAIRAPRVTASGAELRVALDLVNTNPFPVPIEAIQYGLQLNGRKVGSGNVRNVDLGAGKRRRVELPLQVGFGGAASAVKDLIAGEPTNVRLAGSFDFGALQGPLDVAKRLTLDR